MKPGLGALKHLESQGISKGCEDPDAQDPHIGAVPEGQGDIFQIPERFPQGLVTGHRRQEDHCQRVYDGRGEHDKGQGHSCEDTIDA